MEQSWGSSAWGESLSKPTCKSLLGSITAHGFPREMPDVLVPSADAAHGCSSNLFIVVPVLLSRWSLWAARSTGCFPSGGHLWRLGVELGMERPCRAWGLVFDFGDSPGPAETLQFCSESDCKLLSVEQNHHVCTLWINQQTCSEQCALPGGQVTCSSA